MTRAEEHAQQDSAVIGDEEPNGAMCFHNSCPVVAGLVDRVVRLIATGLPRNLIRSAIHISSQPGYAAHRQVGNKDVQGSRLGLPKKLDKIVDERGAV